MCVVKDASGAVFVDWQIIQRQAYSKAVDWWSFGVLLYELITGQVLSQQTLPSHYDVA